MEIQDGLCVHLELARRDARLSKLWLVNTRPPNAGGLARPPQQAAHAIKDKYRIPRGRWDTAPVSIAFQ